MQKKRLTIPNIGKFQITEKGNGKFDVVSTTLDNAPGFQFVGQFQHMGGARFRVLNVYPTIQTVTGQHLDEPLNSQIIGSVMGAIGRSYG